MARFFISYRREDTQYQADMLYRSLSKHVDDPDNEIFIDVDNIPFGVDFVEYLNEKVTECEVLLVLIGQHWLGASDPDTGARRLDNPEDFVRIEIECALNHGIPIVPIVFDDAKVPLAASLPDCLDALTHRNGVRINRLTFDADVARLIKGLPAPRSQLPDDRLPNLKVQSVEQRAAEAAINGGSVFERIFRLEIPGLDGWPNPEMVAIPPGRFVMGSPIEEEGSVDCERPRHDVNIEYVFALGRQTVSFEELDALVAAGALEPEELNAANYNGFGRGTQPVSDIAFDSANVWIYELNLILGLDGRLDEYRLPTEAEWEYACRAGSTTAFWFGETVSAQEANFDGKNGGTLSFSEDFLGRTMPGASYPPNAFGLYQMHGNIGEWCSDNWHENYHGAPVDGSSWEGGDQQTNVSRGGNWVCPRTEIRSAARDHHPYADWETGNGFRLARTLKVR